MGTTFFPGGDAALAEWSQTFAKVLLADGPDVGVSEQQAQAFAEVQQRWQEAYVLARDVATRTRGAIADKDDAKRAMKREARRLAGLVYSQGVTPAQLLALGLTVDAARSKRAAPAQPPVVWPELRDGRTVTLSIVQNEGGRRGRLPAGAGGAIVFRCVGDAPAETMAGWEFIALTGRLTLDVACGADVPPGAQVWFTAAWFSHRKELSPLADARSIHLAGPALVLPNPAARRAA